MDTSENQGLERAMIEGYINTRDDRRALNRDWQIVDGESWPPWDQDEPAGRADALLDPEDRAARREWQ